jgi:heat shock protein beta
MFFAIYFILFYRFFSRVDRVLRRSLGVSETAPTDESVKPAPPVDPSVPDTPVTGTDDGGIPDSVWDKVRDYFKLPIILY